MKEIILVFMAGILVNNYVLQQFLGICPFLGVSKRFNQAAGMGLAVTFVMLCATAATHPVFTFILKPLGLDYPQTIAFILIIAALVQFVEIVIKKFMPALHKAFGVYLPLITTNCAVLGVTINNITAGYDFGMAMISTLGVGVGFLFAMVLFAGVRSRIENCPAPKCFRGVPVTLVAASIVALAFFGFGGIVENIVEATLG